MNRDNTDRPDRGAARPSLGSTAPDTPASGARPARRSRLWLWFVLAFVLQLGAWAAWFIIANQHRVATVPLVTTGTPK